MPICQDAKPVVNFGFNCGQVIINSAGLPASISVDAGASFDLGSVSDQRLSCAAAQLLLSGLHLPMDWVMASLPRWTSTC